MRRTIMTVVLMLLSVICGAGGYAAYMGHPSKVALASKATTSEQKNTEINADEAHIYASHLVSFMQKMKFPSMKGGYAYGWLSFIYRCYRDDDVKTMIVLREVKLKKYFGEFGFDEMRIEGESDALNYLARENDRTYCATAILSKQTLSEAFIAVEAGNNDAQ